MSFTAENIADIIGRVRPMMKSDTRPVSQVFDLRDDENESLTSIALKVMAIEVVIGRRTPADARDMMAIFTPAEHAHPIYPIQAVLDAVEFVEAELA
jgi:hypothetical protein